VFAIAAAVAGALLVLCPRGSFGRSVRTEAVAVGNTQHDPSGVLV
jgi:hypothetical protein